MSEKGKLAREITWIDIEDCADNWWNPNRETADTFNRLHESIQDLGFVQNIQVVAINEELVAAFQEEEDKQKVRELMAQGKKWLILHGSHRVESALLAGKENLSQVPAVVMQANEVYKLMAMSFRLNHIHGRWDLDAVARLYERLVKASPEFSEQAIRDMLGVTSKKELDALINRTKKELPPEMRDALEAARQEIKTIDDLSRVLNELFSRFGEDLVHGFMTFTFGGKLHTMVRLTKEANLFLARVKQFCREHNVDINDVLVYGFRHILGAEETRWPEPLERDLSIAE